MMMVNKKIAKGFFEIKLLLIIVFVFSFSAFAQSNAQMEQELVDAIKDVQKYSTYGSSYDEDKLSKANDIFEEKLLKYTKVPSTLSYKFTELSKLIFKATSEDGKFRVYTWDTESGGTMHEFSRIYQFQGADGKVYSKGEETAEEDGGAGSFVTDVFTIDTKDSRVYIVCSTFIGSTNDHYQSADLFKIEGETIKDKINLIKTKSGLTSKLSFEYNFFSVVDREERSVRLILYDKKTKTLKIPVVINDKEFPNGRVTNKFISYQFDGTYFVKVD